MPLGEQTGRHARDEGLLISVTPLVAGLPLASEYVETFGHQCAGSADRPSHSAGGGFRVQSTRPTAKRVERFVSLRFHGWACRPRSRCVRFWIRPEVIVGLGQWIISTPHDELVLLFQKWHMF